MLRAEPAAAPGPVLTDRRVPARDRAALDPGDPAKGRHRDRFGSGKRGHWPCSISWSFPVQVITFSLISLFCVCKKLPPQPEGLIAQRGSSLLARALSKSALVFLGFGISSATGLTGGEGLAGGWKD